MGILSGPPPSASSDPAGALGSQSSADSSDDPDGAETAAYDALASAFESGDRTAGRKALKAFVQACMSDSSYGDSESSSEL